ncbi:MAG TPA: chloride channel protein [Gemmatimonadales bacterium]|nr:chloride channel protein [Gemmatimonadales bacterium]
MVLLCLAAIAVAVGAGLLAEALTALIALITNIAFHGRVAVADATPLGQRWGVWVIVVPVLGALIVGVMARYGSPAIRGHGIPEVMERILLHESRIAPGITILKPVSTAISIGTGGPFGAEGPIIASGGALGSVAGQIFRVTADERKTLLAAGAAAGMAATFGSPVAATLLAIELLLFEYRPGSLAPVAIASATATAVRYLFHGTAPVFGIPGVFAPPGGWALAAYVVLGAMVGWMSVEVTRGLYRIEDLFERLPIHWMWWPAIGAVVVGVVGWIEPRVFGVGYQNITGILAGQLVGWALFALVTLKCIAWMVALGSGTAGGTLAPLFTIGGGAGSLLAALGALALPALGLDPRIGALVGMAAMFTGASRALLASVVFAFETTRQPLGLLPLLAGCTGGYLISLLRMQSTIMTERLLRRGVPVITEYTVDHLAQTAAGERASRQVVALSAGQSLSETRAWLAGGGPGSSHQGFPVVDAAGAVVGVLTRRDLLDKNQEEARSIGELIRRSPVVAFEASTLREVADLMVTHQVGRVPLIASDGSRRVIGIVSRSDLLAAHERRLDAARPAGATLLSQWGLSRPEPK